MTQTELVFDPFSEEYFNDPFEIYRRMRDEAPFTTTPSGLLRPHNMKTWPTPSRISRRILRLRCDLAMVKSLNPRRHRSSSWTRKILNHIEVCRVDGIEENGRSARWTGGPAAPDGSRGESLFTRLRIFR